MQYKPKQTDMINIHDYKNDPREARVIIRKREMHSADADIRAEKRLAELYRRSLRDFKDAHVFAQLAPGCLCLSISLREDSEQAFLKLARLVYWVQRNVSLPSLLSIEAFDVVPFSLAQPEQYKRVVESLFKETPAEPAE